MYLLQRKNKTAFFLLICGLWLVCSAQDASTKPFPIQPGKVVRVKAPEANNYGFFLLYVPKDYTPAGSWPIIFCYPGIKFLATLFPFRQVTHGIGFIIVGMPLKAGPWPVPPDFDMKSLNFQPNDQLAYFDKTLAIVSSHLNVNKDMVFMGGFSRGSGATAQLGEKRLDQLAGLIILGGGRDDMPHPPTERIRDKPVFIGVGEHDTSANTSSKETVKFYKKVGADVTFEEWPDTGHGPLNIMLTHSTKLGEWLLRVKAHVSALKANPKVQRR